MYVVLPGVPLPRRSYRPPRRKTEIDQASPPSDLRLSLGTSQRGSEDKVTKTLASAITAEPNMPRSSKSTAHTTPRPAATTTTSDSSVTSTDKRVWDTSPNTFPVHLLWLRRWLPKQHRFYRQLVLDGTFSEKGTTYCVSDNHIDRIIFKKLPVGTFTRPCLVAPTDHDETGFPSLSTEQQAAHIERRKSFRIWEAGVASWWETMADHITETIGDQGTADDLTTTSGNHGGVILKMWETRRAWLAWFPTS